FPYTDSAQPGVTLTTSAASGLLTGGSDPYGYALTVVSDPDSSNGTVTNNPDGSFLYTTAHSTLTVQPDGSFTYLAAAGFTGTDRFRFRDFDGLNDSDPATVTINVSANPTGGADSGAGGSGSSGTDDSSGDVTDPSPQAGDDSYTIAPDQTLLTPIGQGVLA